MIEGTSLISVIMSTYNSEKYINNSIDSILSQTYKNFEFLIVDDCSTDNTYDVLKRYSLNNTKIKIFRNNKNIGLTQSLNFLLTKAKGEMIARQDDDDTSKPERLEIQLKTLQKSNLDFCSSRATTNGRKRKIPYVSFYLPKKIILKFKNPFIHGTLFIKKSVLLEVGGYDSNFYYSQDFKLMKDLVMNGYKFKYIKKSLYFLNTKNNISSNYKYQQKYFADCVRKNIIPKIKV